MKRNVINNNLGIYLNYGYLTLPVNISIVDKVKIGPKIFYSKTGYHTSLLYLGNLTETEQLKIVNFASKYKVRLSKITNTFRSVKSGDKESIIVRVKLHGLKRLINEINKHYRYDFVYPPTHITLFNLKGQYGIGINSKKEYEEITKQLDPISVKNIVNSFNLI